VSAVRTATADVDVVGAVSSADVGVGGAVVVLGTLTAC
jgi:hypothetical protein